MERRAGAGQRLDPPAAFGAPAPAGPRGLMPPSHFRPRTAAPRDAGPSGWRPPELSWEPPGWAEEASRGCRAAAMDQPGARTRSLDREAEPLGPGPALATSQEAEIISRQLHKIRRLEAELAGTRATALQQEATGAPRASTAARLQAEADALGTEPGALRVQSQVEADALRAELETLRGRSRAEVDALRAELAGATERQEQEAAAAQGELRAALQEQEAETQQMRERLQGALDQHRVELCQLSAAHGAERDALTQQVRELREELEARGQEAARLEQQRDALQEQLGVAKAELASQNALLQQLRADLCEQNSPPQECLQQAEAERDALRTVVELLQVRLAALGDILALQEAELTRKPWDPLQPEGAMKAQALLSRWREKVFALMVQLKTQELGQAEATGLLRRKVLELEGEVVRRDQQVALLLHSLQEKTAEADMERVKSKTLQADLSHSKDSGQRQQLRAEAAEGALRGLVEAVRSLQQQVGQQEGELRAAVSRLAGLGARVGFAARRVDAIQGLVSQKVALARLQREEPLRAASPEPDIPFQEALQVELAQLHQERDHLAAELKRGAQAVERKMAEAREKAGRELQEVADSLRQVLERKEAVEQECQELQGWLETARQELHNSQEAAKGLKQQLAQLQGEHKRVLQEKVAQVETQLRGDLAEAEKQLSEARREHTKTVVALRQAERQAARDKARSQELARLHDEAQKEEITRLGTRLRELERDRNLLMATLRQEGLLAQFQRSRVTARKLPGEQQGPGLDAALGSSGLQPPSQASLAALLDDLQSLGTALLREEEEEAATAVL
ncbi:coiled-coil alpha-helical rod protein 1-like [Alligator mississippiensis]|uniref:coiled-coil alpha-helical rod protein 1-like n=1 Tax=Alligator mississippiensis TaxID=8496 RepID=UPI002877F1BD|nr:coiled-coil alpha-helical rod protein 1-like [Alligator mississippiensis]